MLLSYLYGSGIACIFIYISEVKENGLDIAWLTKGPPVLAKTSCAIDWNKDMKSEILPGNMTTDIFPIQDDLDVPEGEQVPENDAEISNNSNVSDTNTLTSDNYHQPANSSTGMYDSEDTDSYTNNDSGNSSSSSSDEAAPSKDKMKLLDIEKDDSRRSSPKPNRTCKQNKTKFQCSICDMYLASKPSLMRHCQRRHPDEWFEFKCKDCTCMFKKGKYQSLPCCSYVNGYHGIARIYKWILIKNL